MLRSSVFLVMLSFLFLSCGQDPKNFDDSSVDTSGAQTMSGQEIERGLACSCAFQYDPVCGTNGLTYTNACIANCKGVDYRPGECEEGQKACNPSSGYICGQPPCESGMDCSNGLPHAKAYSNECIMMQAGGAFIHEGLCR